MKKILICVCGGIAAYKIAELVRLLKKNQIDIRIIMTENATRFITPLTLQTLSNYPVQIDMFSQNETNIDHIDLARWADHILISPLSANTLAKLAIGLCDNLITTICLATKAPISVAPAMNHAMWEHSLTQQNIKKIKSIGYQVIPPSYGEQACGEIGLGRMANIETILKHIDTPKPLQNIDILITAGPTIERIDPVRYLSNDSSGKMGYALAEKAQELGANVTLISGPVHIRPPSQVKLIHVNTAIEMLEACHNEINDKNWFIASAAVSDYRIKNQKNKKIKKQNTKPLILDLEENPDILKEIANYKSDLFTVGFAAESDNLIEYATKKRTSKSIDFICANNISTKEIGFNSDYNKITLIGKDISITFETMQKKELAQKLLLTLNDLYLKR